MLLINKPPGPTSHDIVDEVRRITGIKKVGHAGTLDPFAEGLLIILVGREETRKQAEFLNMDKTYEATFVLGEERDTDDVTGAVRSGIFHSTLPVAPSEKSKPRSLTKNDNDPSGSVLRTESFFYSLRGFLSSVAPSRLQRSGKHIPNSSEVRRIMKKFTGEIDQMPPAYSAKKIKGKKAYELARKGEVPELKPKRVKIYEIEVLDYKYPELKIRTKVSSGTYIRALARDIGRELRVGAYVSELKRTEIGEYNVENALSLEDLRKNSKGVKKQ